MIRKIIGMTVCFAVIIIQANAQEFGIELNGGLQGMQYSLKNGQTKRLPAGSLGLNYTFKLNSRLGLLTGITGGLYRTQITLQDGQTFTYNAVDDAGSAFEYRLKFTGYKETQRFFAASIPLLLQYHSAGTGIQWYIDGGAKLFVPFNASSQISAQQVDLTGYYPDFNVELSDLPQHGFGTLHNWKSPGTLRLKPTAALSASTGMIFKLSPGMSLYAGLFVDYGLTNMKDKSDTPRLVTYNANGTNGAQANSVLNTEKAGRATLLSYGLQIRLSFGHTRTTPATHPNAAALPTITAPSDTSTRSKTTTQPRTGAPVGTKESVSPMPTQGLNPDDAAIINEPIIFGIVGETSIPAAEQSHMEELTNLLKRDPNIRLSIIGHYCDGEMVTESSKIGEARAKAVMKYLQKKGIPRNRMTAAPASTSDTALRSDPAANYQHRRVVIEVRP